MGNGESRSDTVTDRETATNAIIGTLLGGHPVAAALGLGGRGRRPNVPASINAASAENCVATNILAKPADAVPYLMPIFGAILNGCTPFGFSDPRLEILMALEKLVMDTISTQSEGDGYAGYFILALLFEEHETYMSDVFAAFLEEARNKSSSLQSIFVPGGDIRDRKWEKTKVKMYVFSQYGNYIDQKHSIVHKGLIVVYKDQSKQSSDLFTFHRFDLLATTKEDYRNLKGKIEKRPGIPNSDPSASFAKSAIPLNELAEEFYYRSLMKIGKPSHVPRELVKILQNSRPHVFAQQLMDIVEGSAGISPVEMAEAIIAKDFSVFASPGASSEAFRASFLPSGSSSSRSSSSRSSRSSHVGENNMLTQELNLRKNLDFPERQSVASFEGVIEEATLPQLWCVLQTTMGDYPPMYNLVTANCIWFCNAVIDNLKSVLDMNPDMGSNRATVYKLSPGLELEDWIKDLI